MGIKGNLYVGGQVYNNSIPKYYTLGTPSGTAGSTVRIGTFTTNAAASVSNNGYCIHMKLYYHTTLTPGIPGGDEDFICNINAKILGQSPWIESWHTIEGPNRTVLIPYWADGGNTLSGTTTFGLYVSLLTTINNSFYTVLITTTGCSWTDNQSYLNPPAVALNVCVQSTDATNIIYSTENSSTSSTGALQIRGGVGIGKDVNVGGVTKLLATTVTGGLFVSGGPLNVAAGYTTTISGPLTVAASQATSLGGTLTVANSNATSLTGTLNVTGNIFALGGLYVGIDDGSLTNNNTKSIFFGGVSGDTGYNLSVIESRIYGGVGDQSELLLFKGNDGTDRIRLFAGEIRFDTGTNATTVDRTAENNRMIILANGNVGIANTSPSYILHVTGTTTSTTFNASSDKRIKTNITDISGSSLDILRKIKPREYTMIDTKKPRYGFIAQEVKQHILRAVELSTDYIPSVYENAFVKGNTITLINKSTTDISNCKLKLRDISNDDIIVNVAHIQDDKTFYTNEDISQNKLQYMDIYGNHLDKQINNGKVVYKIGSDVYTGEVKQGLFVYGIQVNDFHSINHDTIWTVAVGATQEMDVQLQEARQTIKSLEERISAIERLLLREPRFPEPLLII